MIHYWQFAHLIILTQWTISLIYIVHSIYDLHSKMLHKMYYKISCYSNINIRSLLFAFDEICCCAKLMNKIIPVKLAQGKISVSCHHFFTHFYPTKGISHLSKLVFYFITNEKVVAGYGNFSLRHTVTGKYCNCVPVKPHVEQMSAVTTWQPLTTSQVLHCMWDSVCTAGSCLCIIYF